MVSAFLFPQSSSSPSEDMSHWVITIHCLLVFQKDFEPQEDRDHVTAMLVHHCIPDACLSAWPRNGPHKMSDRMNGKMNEQLLLF